MQSVDRELKLRAVKGEQVERGVLPSDLVALQATDATTSPAPSHTTRRHVHAMSHAVTAVGRSNMGQVALGPICM